MKLKKYLSISVVIWSLSATAGETEPAKDSAQSSTVELPKIVVSAVRRESELKFTPSILDVVGLGEFEAVSASRISDALRYVPGMNIEQGTGSGGPFKKNITINGMPNFYNVVMVDGMRLLSSHSQTGTNIDMIPASAVERVEIIKDASSALYGSDALGGVVNIITKRGHYDPQLQASIGAGSYKTWKTEVARRGTLPQSKVSYSLYAGYEKSDGPDIIAPAHRIGHLDYRKSSFINRFDYTPNESVDISAYLNFVMDDAEFGDARSIIGDTTLLGIDGESSRWYQVETEYEMMTAWLLTPGIDMHIKVNDKLRANVSGYYSQWNGEISSELQEIASPRVHFTYDFNNCHALTLGGEYLWNKYFRSGMPGTYDQHTGSGFLQYQGFFADSIVSVLGALRSDYVRNTVTGANNIGPVFSPKLSFVVNPIDMLTVRATLARGFKSPSVMELYEDRFHRNYFRLGNPDLEEEYSTNLAAGIVLEPLSFLGLSANVYNNIIDNMIIITREAQDRNNQPVYKRYNLQEGRISGVEGRLGLDWKMFNFQIGGSAVAQSGKSEGDSLKIPYFPGTTIFSRLSVEQPLTKVLTLGGFVGYMTQMDRTYWSFKSDEVSKLDDLQELEAGISLSIAKMATLQFRAGNLLSQKQETYEDVLMKIEGEPRFEGGIEFTLR